LDVPTRFANAGDMFHADNLAFRCGNNHSLQEKCAALEKENASLRASQGGNSENGMTDYQFKTFMALLRETVENAFELGNHRRKSWRFSSIR